MTQLKAYRSKRDLDKTQEPAGVSTGTSSSWRYVLHKHDASQLHYDLRLEQDGVLRSWAVPKGPSLKVGDKRLAVEVEDHPLEYGDFEGIIPKEAYGGGTVMVWDRGEWEPSHKDKSKNTAGHIDFVLHGKKLTGAWTLVRMSGQGNERKGNNKQRNWLLIKRHDPEEPAHDAKTLVGLGDQSVLSGRSMDRIAADHADDVDHADEPERSDDETRRDALPDSAALDGARKSKLPKTVQPQLATLVRTAPQGDDWLHEFKLDGYRLLARLKNGQVQLLSRNDKDWTQRFPQLATAIERLPVDEALLDGEAIVLGADGISNFERLQEALSAGGTDHVVYQAFDLLHLNGYDLMPVPQGQRKQALSQLLASGGTGGDGGSTVRYTEHLQEQGPDFFRQACRLGLEGIVCKRADSAYATGRSKRWLKVKCVHHAEFVVGGFTDPKGARSGFGSLLLGAYDNADNLVYCGRVGTGFSDRQLGKLHEMLRKDVRKTKPFDGEVPDVGATHWLHPRIVIEVEYTQRTRDGRLRHPSFRGLREDKNVDEVRLPETRHTPARKSKPSRRKVTQRRGAATGSATVAGVRLTHPQRVVYPEMGVTKLDLARHFEAIQDWILPTLADRPVSLLRCLDGRDGNCFFQKHPGDAIPDHLPRITITEKKGPRDYVYVHSIADLVGLIQAGTLELHVWGSRIDDIERPDTLVFDLDPAPDVAWKETVRVARDFDKRLQDLGLTSFLRTTGGKGLHLVVPLTRSLEWDDAKTFAHAVAQQHARTDPKRLTTNMSKDKRRGRIYIDYLRNGRGATAIASYSPRAREGAPVAVPIRWNELSPALHSDRYHIGNLRQRLSALDEDPWAGFAAAKRPITKKMLRAVDGD